MPRYLHPLLCSALTAILCISCSPPSGEEGGPRGSAASPGPYLGQPLPGDTPVPFAPGIVSTGFSERDVAMTPDGGVIYWGVVGGNYAWSTIMGSRQVEGRWTEPEVAACCRDLRYMELEPHITPDGEHFLWLSSRPGGAQETPGGQDIWAMDRVGEGWGEPSPLPAPVNTTDSEYFPSATRDGTLYFTRSPAGGGENRVYRSRKVDGAYQEPELLPPQVNGGLTRYNAFVDPDERYLILGVVGGPESRGGTDYVIVFRSPGDHWSEPVNLGSVVNTEDGFEYSPYVSPDGRFFFFMTARPDWGLLAPDGQATAGAIRGMATQPNNGAWDIYWMSAEFLERLRPAGF